MSAELVLSSSALSVQQVVEQRELIKSAMKSAMEEGMHYGKVPGCGEKPSLMQPGAQLLGYLFKVRPEYEIQEKDFDGEHREYRITCRLFHQAAGEVGQGVGICSTRESKYRYRNASREAKFTDQPVPKIYWSLREKPEGMTRWLKQVFPDKENVANIGVKKNDSQQWMFVEFEGGEGKVENTNIADVFNTVLKIAKKRAFVDAIITATASNDLFTQDLEDIKANLDAVETVTPKPVEKNVTPPDEGKNLAAPDKATGSGKSEGTPVESRSIGGETPPAAAPRSYNSRPQDQMTTTWRDVVCHIGTNGGKVNGRKLGDLGKDAIEWIGNSLAKIQSPTQADNLLKAALAMREAEMAPTPAQTELGSSRVNLEVLRAKAVADKVPLATIAAVSRTLGGSAKSFEDIPEDEASHLVAGWTETLNLSKDELP